MPGVQSRHGGAGAKAGGRIVFVTLMFQSALSHPDRVEVRNIAVAIANITTSLNVHWDTRRYAENACAFAAFTAYNCSHIRICPTCSTANRRDIQRRYKRRNLSCFIAVFFFDGLRRRHQRREQHHNAQNRGEPSGFRFDLHKNLL